MHRPPSTLVSLKVTVALLQLSVAVRVAAAGTASHSALMSPGSASTKTGAVVSCTVMVCDKVVFKLQSSVADQVLSMVYVHPLPIMFWVYTTDTLRSQLSMAVTVGGAGISSQLTVVSFGTPTNSGDSKSPTVTNWVAMVWLPHSSVAVQVLFSW